MPRWGAALEPSLCRAGARRSRLVSSSRAESFATRITTPDPNLPEFTVIAWRALLHSANDRTGGVVAPREPLHWHRK
jgi:hypothetical protein